MPFVGSIIPQQVLRLGHEARKARRAAEERRDDPAGARGVRDSDQTEITAPDAVSANQPAERVAGNDSERAREDHEANLVGGAYDRPDRQRQIGHVQVSQDVVNRARGRRPGAEPPRPNPERPHPVAKPRPDTPRIDLEA